MASTFKVVQWSESYRLGLDEVDEQHHTLIDLMNDLWAVIAANAPIQDSEKILVRLERYTVEHFTSEEKMMQALGYPKFEVHKRAHEHFVARLQAELARHENGQKLNLDILNFLRDWLVNHILVNDKDYAEFYANRTRPAGFLKRFFTQFNSAFKTNPTQAA